MKAGSKTGRFLLRFFRDIVCVDGAAEDNKGIIEILRNEIQDHINGGDKIFVPEQLFCKEVSQYC